MQLPPADELVLVSGMAPIRAKKLRYFKDRNFRARLAPPPALGDGDYPDCPQERPDDWSGYVRATDRSEEHTSELQSLMRISYAVFCLKKQKTKKRNTHIMPDITDEAAHTQSLTTKT